MKTRLKIFIFSCLVTFSLVTAGATCAEIPLFKSQREKLLKKYPEADINKDGVLTGSEASSFQRQVLVTMQRNRVRRIVLAEPSFVDVSYGPDERNVLDLWLVEAKQPAPLIIYIHGGGFVAGSKNGVSPRLIMEAHKKGISVAAINYRFVKKHPFPAPQHDGARAVQFLRYHAKKYNLDPERFAAFGGSAGAGISMWLAYHDDLANSKSKDPIERVSSRLVAVGSIGGQSTYDPAVIKKWIGGRAHEHPSIYFCYNVKTMQELTDPKLQPMFDEVSAITHLTRDDPPTFMYYNEPDKPLREGAVPGEGIHHPQFGIKLKEALDKLGIESELHIQDLNSKTMIPAMLNFFEKQFAKQ